MFRQNDGISWTILTCSREPMGSTLDAARISNRSEDANMIDRFPPRHCFEGDGREIANANSERCLEPSRSLRSPPACVTRPYFVSSGKFSRTRPRGESLLMCVLRMATGTDKSTSIPPRASHRRTLNLRTRGHCPCKAVSTIVTGRRGPISSARSVSQNIWASISAKAGTRLRFVASLVPDTHLQRMQRGWLV